ncbi:divergent PAP2 family protein [Chloroflexota bacterium]
MNEANILTNQVLICALLAWLIAQIIKVPLEFIRASRWDWSLLLRAGGMPSSHSALVASLAHSVGVFVGFGTPLFAAVFVVAMIVVYDATGIRRQAGKHAEIINKMILDLTSGHPLKEEQLREVLGHTPLEALAGTILGVIVAHLGWLILR